MSISKNTQVFYIHGFGSSPQSDTLKQLQKEFPSAIGLTYDHTNPASSIRSLAFEIFKYVDKDCIVVGSSLGGWYIEQLTRSVVANFIMYNPSTQPEKSLEKYGVPQEVLFEYKKLSVPVTGNVSRNVILSIDDAVIDPVVADNKYKNIADMSYTAGGHRITKEAMDIIISKIRYLENQLP